MRMKVHNKGQVVIPVDIRRQLDISIGDHLDVEVDVEQGQIRLRKPVTSVSYRVGGSLASFAADKPFPSTEEAAQALRDALTRGA